MAMVRWIVYLQILLPSSTLLAQQQLVVLKKDKVKVRFNEGSIIRYNTFRHTVVQNDIIVSISDTAVITRRDTIALHHFDKIYFEKELFKGSNVRTAAYKLITAGILLQAGDYITVTAVQNNRYTLNKGVTFVSAALVAAGVTILAVKKPFIRIRKHNRLKVIHESSPFYKFG